MRKILVLCTLFAFTATILPRASDASPTVKAITYKASVEKICVVADHAAIVPEAIRDGKLAVFPYPVFLADIASSPNHNFRTGIRRTTGVDRYYNSFKSSRLEMVKGTEPVQRE